VTATEDPFAFRFTADSTQRAMSVLADEWTGLIVRESFFGVVRFGQLQRNLGIARNVLTDRLGRLIDAGVLERVQYRSDPDWFEYRLTERGRDLFKPLMAFMRWGDDYLAGPEGPPLILHHNTCGHDTRPVVVCEHCRAELDARDVTPRPGPGAHAASEPADAVDRPRMRRRR
jgi:DNA-binding HxlR family transcriptional regulator